ncbi:MAG: chloride channel protein [Polyangiales bacterium]|nr:chloride channel protein [Myxococcales bacterium]
MAVRRVAANLILRGQRTLDRLRAAFWRDESRRMLVLSIGVGIACGLAAALLISLLATATNLFFGHTSGRSTLWVIAIPAVGGLLVGPLVTRFAPESKGHGVPEVMLAVARNDGRIRPRVALFKTIASAITIGSGGSAGREGPIVQIGAAIGSVAGQLLGEPPEILRMLVACGSASGIAASFNAPIAGVVFALEVILRDFTARAFAMVVAAAVAASVLSRTLLGQHAFFEAPQYAMRSPKELVFYLILGVLAAWTARVFIRVLYAFEDGFEKFPIPNWIKPAVGGLAMGALLYFLPEVRGTGHEAVESALHGEVPLQLLAVLLVGKMLATSFTLGSGGSGGVFAPSLFMGAMLGGIVGTITAWLFPGLPGPVGGYALVGMGAVFAGSSFAPMTAILIIFEMTHDYAIILPLMAACVTSVLVSHAISEDSIYTLKLRRRGIDLDAMDEHGALARIRVGDVMTRTVDVVTCELPVLDLLERVRRSPHSGFPVVDADGLLVGLLTHTELRSALEDSSDFQASKTSELMRPAPPVARPSETLAEITERMHHHDIDRLPVVAEDSSGRLIGLITDHDLVNALVAGAPSSHRPRARSKRAQAEARLRDEHPTRPQGTAPGEAAVEPQPKG